jgi:methyltransferase (TIGR00027 family)
MAEGKVSTTASMIVLLKAAHQILDADPKILVDPLAVGFVPDSSADELRADAAWHQSPLGHALRANAVMRSRYVEDILEDMAASGMRQYVNMGAGLDTFAYRQPAWAQASTIYEVDQPATQRWKQASLQRLGIVPPANLRWCPLNFEEGGLRAGLAAAGFDPAVRACFAWLGVTPYLTDAAIDSTLRFVSSLGSGNSIVFSFILPNSYLTGAERAMMQEIATRVEAFGEPLLTEFEPTLLRDRLRAMGFSRVVHFTAEAANDRYFVGRADGLRVLRLEELMWATV